MKNTIIGMGIRVRKTREELGFTREKLAEQVDISTGYLAEIELESKNMSSYTLSKMCTALSTSSDYLLFGRSERANPDLILEMLSNLDDEYVDYARDLLKTYILAVGKAKRG